MERSARASAAGAVGLPEGWDPDDPRVRELRENLRRGMAVIREVLTEAQWEWLPALLREGAPPAATGAWVRMKTMGSRGCRAWLAPLALALGDLFWGGPGPGLVAWTTMDVTGGVRDSLNNEALPNAVVRLHGDGQRTRTDEFGRYSLVGLPCEARTLEGSFRSYGSTRVLLDGEPDGPAEIRLLPRAIELAGVTVATSTDLVQPSDEVGQVTRSRRRLNTPAPVGEADIVRSPQLLPGVSGAHEASSGLHVRGCTSDENLVLLDGMTVYHVGHFFGVFGAVNADAVKAVRLFQGGYPACWAGGTSRVVDRVGKSGGTEAFRASGPLNLPSAGAVIEVPLSGKGSRLVSARRSYADLIRTPLYDGLFGTVRGGEAEEASGGPAGGPGGNDVRLQ